MEAIQSFDFSVLNGMQNYLKCGLLLGMLCVLLMVWLAKLFGLERKINKNN